MGLVFATHNPTAKETLKLRLLLSTYLDGTGNQRDKDGGTRASWREIERCVAELVGSATGEDKGIFDVVAADVDTPRVHYGFSVKSKQYGKSSLTDLDESGRVYMEIANSPAKFWDPLRQNGLTEADFTAKKHADSFGKSVLSTVASWHRQGKQEVEQSTKHRVLDLAHSCYLSVTYSKSDSWENREYQVHTFSLSFPPGIKWAFTSERCLRGYDPACPTEALFDWYALSGGQLKYYPKAKQALFKTPIFTLVSPRRSMSVVDKAKAYFPNLWPHDELAEA